MNNNESVKKSDKSILLSVFILVVITGSFFVGVVIGQEQKSVEKITDLENK